MTIIQQNDRPTYTGTGRRKASVARVRLIPGSGKLIINGLPGESYLQFSRSLVVSDSFLPRRSEPFPALSSHFE